DGERHHLDFVDLTGGGTVTVWAQTEIVKDLVAARLADGDALEFEAEALGVDDLDSDRPVIRYRDVSGATRDLRCDVIAGCDGFHGISRPAIPSPAVVDHDYPYAWLGILADVPPSTDELIYAYHRRGFALHSLRSPEVSRLYLQVAPDERIEAWPDDRIWSELATRLGVDGWTLQTGSVREKGITPMRSFVSEPMRYGRLFLAGDVSHIVPPTGAKGLNLAMADAAALAEALEALLLRGDDSLADGYSDRCLRRVWRATHFSWWMTSMLHRSPTAGPFDEALQLSQLRYVTTSRAAAASLAENYVGHAMRSA
ncbi:MAG TPA: 4-hydroxybenzoate 3-monooxygenase, partial [Micromonosporaceae bacterium]